MCAVPVEEVGRRTCQARGPREAAHVRSPRGGGRPSGGELGGMRISLPSILWLVVGALVASAHHYLENLDAIRPVVSAVLAVVLWPLLLLGINLHVH
jgi:hypothetical protein